MLSNATRRPQTLARTFRGGSTVGRTRSPPISSLSSSSGSDDTDAPQTQKDLEKNDAAGESYIQRGKRLGANALLGYLTTTTSRFDRTMDGLKVVKLGDGWVRCEMEATESVLNSYGTIHGGALSTIVDISSTIALMTKDVMKAGVSVELNVSFASAAKAGEQIVIEAWVLKMGRKLGFTQVDVRRKSDGQLIVSGRHTKAL
eukprot:gb/GECG01007358.1/.p1 GENE.gb/GECG01007358.1/~~gb/GECG01007358.1/.p1  ORF type:complete len:202 (+),score=24.50 gb/GECG01007358.1/:1-606(+)